MKSYSKFFQSSFSNPVSSRYCKVYRILRALLYTAISPLSALLAHVASHNMRTVSDTFRRRTVPPTRNMNDSRSHNNTSCPLRSPPPVANRNRSRAVLCVYVTVTTCATFASLYPAVHLRIQRAGCFALGATRRSVCTHHL